MVRNRQQTRKVATDRPRLSFYVRLGIWPGVDDRHAKTGRTAGYRRTDATHADNPDDRGMDIVAEKKVGSPLPPFVGTNMADTFAHTTSRGDEQTHRKIGRGLR